MPKMPDLLSKQLLRVTLLVSLLAGGCQNQPQATAPQALPVRLETLEATTIQEFSEFVGSLDANQRVSLAPRISGRILQIFVESGTPVKQGDRILLLEPEQQQEEVNSRRSAVLARQAELSSAEADLNSAEAERARTAAELGRAKSDLQDAQAELDLAQVNYERSQFLVKQGVEPQQNLDDRTRDLNTSTAKRDAQQEVVNAQMQALQAAEARIVQARANIARAEAQVRQAEADVAVVTVNLQDNLVVAPIDGIVGDIPVRVGDFVNIGQELTSITDNDVLEIRISVPVQRRSQLRLGQPVEIVNADGTPGIKGEITFISPNVNQSTQTILTKASFNNDQSLKNSEFVRVKLIWDERPGLLLPTTAVTNIGNQKFVFVATPAEDSELVVEQRPVEVGGIQGQAYQVISGLEAGDQIAVSRILDLTNGRAIVPETTQSQSN